MNALELKSFYKKFPTEEVCLEYLERTRWPDGRVCPHCGSKESYRFKDRKLFKCKSCQRQFTVKVGTVFTDSHVPLQEWFLAIRLLMSEQQGIGSVQLAEYIGVTQKTAWLMIKRIRTRLAAGGADLADASFDDVLKKLVAPPVSGRVE